MESRSEVQYRPQTVISQWLSETGGGGDEWVVAQMMDGHVIRSERVSSQQEAIRIKQQWENSGDC